MALAVAGVASPAWAGNMGVIKGVVKNASGKALGGVMVSAFDPAKEVSVTVFSQPDGSFVVDGLEAKSHNVRVRLIGLEDAWQENVAVGAADVAFKMDPAKDLSAQRPANDLFSFVKFEDPKDRANFKMMCTYCHQVGTIGFRTPEEPVDWQTMVSRMDGFGGLYKHTQATIVDRLLAAYSPEAQKSWPEYVPPPAPSGKALEAVVTEWDGGKQDGCMIHDLEIGKDNNLVYTCDMINDCIYELNVETGVRTVYGVPGGKDPESTATPRKGPHSIECAPDGNMWLTLALSGEMAKFDVKTHEYTLFSSNVAPKKRGGYPHTLRVDEKGVVWYTDAAMNAVFSLDPANNNVVKQYQLLAAEQAAAAGRGESGGITPYGVAVAPDGKVWYTKLNGNRLGVIDPAAPDGAIKEYKPPFEGPRRHDIGKDGIVWVPGFGSGVLGAFNPKTEEWKVYPLPDAENEIPYALNVHPTTGEVWICGTGSDSMYRFIPATEEFVKIPMPSRVTYTREVEFAMDGSVWTCNSNYPVRHVERAKGSVIRIALDPARAANAGTTAD